MTSPGGPPEHNPYGRSLPSFSAAMARSPVRRVGNGVLLDVIVSPGAARSELRGFDASRGAVRIRVAAAPSKGAANREALRLLAARLGVPASSLRITSGLTDRRKTVSIAGLDETTVARRLTSRRDDGLPGTP